MKPRGQQAARLIGEAIFERVEGQFRFKGCDMCKKLRGVREVWGRCVFHPRNLMHPRCPATPLRHPTGTRCRPEDTGRVNEAAFRTDLSAPLPTRSLGLRLPAPCRPPYMPDRQNQRPADEGPGGEPSSRPDRWIHPVKRGRRVIGVTLVQAGSSPPM